MQPNNDLNEPAVPPTEDLSTAPKPAETPADLPTNTSTSPAGVIPTTSKKNPKLIIVAVIVAALLIGGSVAAYLMNNKPETLSIKTNPAPTSTATDSEDKQPATDQTSSTPAATVKPPAPTTTPAATSVNKVDMVKDYISKWKSDEAKAIAYLNLAKMKQDPTCMNSCSDEDIIEPERYQYTNPNIVIDSITLSPEGTVKVQVHDKSSTPNPDFPQNGGYEYALEANGSSWLIVDKGIFFE